MENFAIVRPASLAAATQSGGTFIAGGTDLIQLWQNNVEQPRQVVDLDAVGSHDISVGPDGLRLGALVTMAETAEHPAVRSGWPAISQALLLSASPQIRNMGTMGGNLLQRTRCGYFRDTGFACNKRAPGSGCPAITGDNRDLAIFGGSEHCIATQPSDMPVALVALGANVVLQSPQGGRTIPLADLYRAPADTPQRDTNLRPGEVIIAIVVPASMAARRSAYLKVRDRTSYAFALASAAVALDIDAGTIRDARAAAGGVGVMPWRLPSVEAALRGKPASPEVLSAAAQHAGDGATPASNNAFKVRLLQRTVLRALRSVAA